MTSRLVVWAAAGLLVGFLLGIFVVEHLAPTHPTWFCKPLNDGTCEPYPWGPR